MSIEAGMPNYSGCHAHWTPITYTSVAAGVWVLTDTKPTTGTSSDRDRRPLKPEFAGSKVNLALARSVSVHARGGVFKSIRSVGCGGVEVVIGADRLRWSCKTFT